MLKCLNCSHVFDESEAATEQEPHYELDGAPCEYFSVCPNCHSEDISDAYQCEVCGEWFFGDEIIDGHYCESCLREAVDYDSFKEFALSKKASDKLDIQYSDQFSLLELFVLEEICNYSSSQIERTMPSDAEAKFWLGEEVYNTRVEKDKPIFKGDEQPFLEQIRQYIFDCDLAEWFADWLYKKNLGGN